MRYFAVLYTPPAKRQIATAIFVIDAEIRESAQSANHDVAHTRLQWWRQEIDRLINANAQHPATRVLSLATKDHRAFAKLHELIVAADMDLARMTYANDAELRAYCARSGGAVAEMFVTMLAAPGEVDDTTRAIANRIGALVRATEIVRDARQDAYDARMYVPLDLAERQGLTHEQLRSKEIPPAGRTALAAMSQQIRDDMATSLASIPTQMQAYFRPLYVLGQLHSVLLKRIADRNFEVGAERIELGPIRKSWTAWRAARRAG
jgi:phytoene synthase